MKLTYVCLNADGDTLCSKCHETIGNQVHHKGIWFPERPFEPNGTGRGYVYALCMPCHEEVVDKKTNMPCKTWLSILEDEIQELITSKRSNRVKLDSSKMSEKRIFEEQMFLLTGRRG
ncbi:MAG: hypothetical protein Q7J35_03515 [Candidatus Methanoperedens sp.]|nr:hypothetical protein [Candidatus Methanoperedens sp.]